MLLALVAITATLWLAVSGKLGLYIHPRYFVFTVVMACIGAVLVVAAFAIVPDPAVEEDHVDHEAPPRRWRVVPAAAVVIGAILALLVLPPETLTSATAAQRSVNSSTASLSRGDTTSLIGGSTSAFSVKDWSVLLAQNSSASFFQDKKVDVVGFISASPDDPQNEFYITRFVVTCCAVDAQPVGIPVHMPGWQSTFAADEWVEATGQFTSPAASSTKLTLSPTTLEKTTKPDQPYVF